VANPYYSFLLRVFKVGSSCDVGWLATLQEIHSQRVFNFSNLEKLAAFLDMLPAGLDDCSEPVEISRSGEALTKPGEK
jgi:hypothetical protein